MNIFNKKNKNTGMYQSNKNHRKINPKNKVKRLKMNMKNYLLEKEAKLKL